MWTVVSEPIHQALRGNRQAAGLSQTAVAARMGTTQSVVARAESRRGPAHTISFLERFAAATGRPLTVSIIPEHATPPSVEELSRLAPRIREAGAAHGIESVAVVGSVARGAARPDSDVDLFVTVRADLKGAAYFAALDEFREACLRIVRRPVDVIERSGVRDDGIRRHLLREAHAL